MLASSDGRASEGTLREAAWQVAGAHHSKLFVAEIARPDINQADYESLDIAAFLLGQIRRCRRFICLLHGQSRGSPISLSGKPVSSTFFELELYQAVRLGLPIYLLVHETFKPEELEAFLDLVDFGFVDWRARASHHLGDAQIVAAVGDIVGDRKQAQQWLVAPELLNSPRMHQSLWLLRDHIRRGDSEPKFHFLRANRIASQGRVDQDTVRQLMLSRKPFEEEPDNDKRLARAWLLARELLNEPLFNGTGAIMSKDPIILEGWNAMLTDWHGAASWGGLHSHIYLGTLPTLNTLAMVRKQHQTFFPRSQSEVDPMRFPGGAYASSYYSLAKRLPSKHRPEAFETAVRMLKMGQESGDTSGSNMLAVMGSIAFARRQFGEAVSLYQQAAAIREREDKGGRAHGEILCELALGRLFVGSVRRAARDISEGLAIMHAPRNGIVVEDGFLVRALRKGTIIYLANGQIRKALDCHAEAKALAIKHNLDDQLAQLTRLEPAYWTQRLRRRISGLGVSRLLKNSPKRDRFV
jgi:hypothetical protein